MINKPYGYIYLVTNLINGKQYTGQTVRTINKRFAGHISDKTTYMSRAINKYGKENFKIEQIDVAYNQEELDLIEGVYMAWFNTLAPNGYNIQKIISGQGKHSEETKRKMSVLANTPEKLKRSSENGKKTKQTKKNFESKFLGVHKTKNKNITTWSTFFKHNFKNIHIGVFNNEIDAAIAYDISVINIIGKDAKINFENNRENYINNTIKIPKREQNKGSKKTGKCNTKYCGVNKLGNNFRSRICINNKTIELGVYKSQKEAAYARDIADLKYFGNNAVLNFPELREDYINGKIIPQKIKKYSNKKSNSKILGVSFYSPRKKWVVQLKGLKTKRFNNLKEAEKYAIEYLKIRDNK